MAIYDEGDGDKLAELSERFGWVPEVLAVEYGERDDYDAAPPQLNWLELIPDDPRYDFADVECSLAYVSDTTGYTATVWDATGEDDLPWAVLLADDYGVRLLSEYSVLDEDADDETLEAVLQKSAAELAPRLESGTFDRTGTPIVVPDWLMTSLDDEKESA